MQHVGSSVRSRLAVSPMQSRPHRGEQSRRVSDSSPPCARMRFRLKKRFVAAVLLCLAGCASSNQGDAPLSEDQTRSSGKRPNIVMILGDDLGPQLQCYGDSIARTPNFDRLAREGMRFTNAYVTQASCS